MNGLSLANILGYFRKLIFEQRLGNWVGVLVGVFGGLFFGYVTGKMGLQMNIVLIGMCVGTPIMIAAIFNIRFGIALVVSIAYVLLGVKRAMPQIPFGLFTDFMIVLLAFGVFYKNLYSKDWSFARGKISYWVLAYMGYVFITFPIAPCKPCYIFAIRSMALYMLMYFIVAYSIQSKKDIKFYIKLWIFWSTLAGLYAIKQELIGFTSWEDAWIHADDERFWLLFQWGRIRKFSFMADPTNFGIAMGFSCLPPLILQFAPLKLWKKAVLILCTIIMVQGMLYSGTRSAFVVLPIGLMPFLILIKNMKIYAAAAIGALMLGVIIVMPSGNPTLSRFQSAFKPGEDASYLVRLENQKRVRPWIWKHPLGGGLGGTGTIGTRFAPHSFLANFPPDSGYVRVAVELGWVGLTIFIGLWATVLLEGIKSVLKIRDPVMSFIGNSMLCVMFSLYVVNYAQQTINQLPTSLLFWVAAAIISRGSQLEEEEKQKGNLLLQKSVNDKQKR